MREIPLQENPNQSLSASFEDGNNRWQVTIKQAVTSMIVDVIINDVNILTGSRIPGDDFILPYKYMGIRQGNLILTTQQNILPDWNLFDQTQRLFYWSPEEMAALSNG